MDMIDKFRHAFRFSNTGCERDMIIEPCSKEERVNMDTSGNSYASYF